jgi:hypothetical protein
MASARDSLEARIYFYQPAGSSNGWARTDLWRSASDIPGVQVIVDEDGRMARDLGAATSGQALLYGAEGQLLFSGGLTDSRGHSGESVGGRAVLSFLSNPRAALVTTPVYGCSLLGPARTVAPVSGSDGG